MHHTNLYTVSISKNQHLPTHPINHSHVVVWGQSLNSIYTSRSHCDDYPSPPLPRLLSHVALAFFGITKWQSRSLLMVKNTKITTTSKKSLSNRCCCKTLNFIAINLQISCLSSVIKYFILCNQINVKNFYYLKFLNLLIYNYSKHSCVGTRSVCHLFGSVDIQGTRAWPFRSYVECMTTSLPKNKLNQPVYW